MTLNEALLAFLHDKQLAGVKENSIRNYKITISLMLLYLDPNTPISDLTLDMVNDYILYLYQSSISRSTQSSYIRNDRIFLRWVYLNYGLSFDPQRIKIPKSPKKNVHIYNDSELLYLFECVNTSVPWITARNRAIIAFMLDSGLRQMEICGLLKSNIDRFRMVIKVTGKGSKDRLVPLGTLTLYLMDEYLALCPFKCSESVFCDKLGNELSGNAIRLFVNRLAKKLPFELTSHKLRHNFATNYCIDHIEQTGNSHVYDLSIIMGHESIETTKRYEHFAHELIAAKNSISHLDTCLGNKLKTVINGGFE